MSFFDPSPETARRLIALGRRDARKALAEAGMEKEPDVVNLGNKKGPLK